MLSALEKAAISIAQTVPAAVNTLSVAPFNKWNRVRTVAGVDLSSHGSGASSEWCLSLEGTQCASCTSEVFFARVCWHPPSQNSAYSNHSCRMSANDYGGYVVITKWSQSVDIAFKSTLRKRCPPINLFDNTMQCICNPIMQCCDRLARDTRANSGMIGQICKMRLEHCN